MKKFVALVALVVALLVPTAAMSTPVVVSYHPTARMLGPCGLNGSTVYRILYDNRHSTGVAPDGVVTYEFHFFTTKHIKAGGPGWVTTTRRLQAGTFGAYAWRHIKPNSTWWLAFNTKPITGTSSDAWTYLLGVAWPMKHPHACPATYPGGPTP